jgi:uncharacterized membrane protein YebE (DUF533 family)
MAKLGKDVFIALAAIAWADGRLDQDEADAIVRAAAEEGLELDDIAEIEEATKSPVDLSVLAREGLGVEDRMFVYAVATWIARLDGPILDEEAAVLAALGDRLGLPDRPRAQAEAAAREVAALPEGDRPPRYDLPALRRKLGERLRPRA